LRLIEPFPSTETFKFDILGRIVIVVTGVAHLTVSTLVYGTYSTSKAITREQNDQEESSPLVFASAAKLEATSFWTMTVNCPTVVAMMSRRL
jgi:hypothetical protein